MLLAAALLTTEKGRPRREFEERIAAALPPVFRRELPGDLLLLGASAPLLKLFLRDSEGRWWTSPDDLPQHLRDGAPWLTEDTSPSELGTMLGQGLKAPSLAFEDGAIYIPAQWVELEGAFRPLTLRVAFELYGDSARARAQKGLEAARDRLRDAQARRETSEAARDAAARSLQEAEGEAARAREAEEGARAQVSEQEARVAAAPPAASDPASSVADQLLPVAEAVEVTSEPEKAMPPPPPRKMPLKKRKRGNAIS